MTLHRGFHDPRPLRPRICIPTPTRHPAEKNRERVRPKPDRARARAIRYPATSRSNRAQSPNPLLQPQVRQQCLRSSCQTTSHLSPPPPPPPSPPIPSLIFFHLLQLPLPPLHLHDRFPSRLPSLFYYPHPHSNNNRVVWAPSTAITAMVNQGSSRGGRNTPRKSPARRRRSYPTLCPRRPGSCSVVR